MKKMTPAERAALRASIARDDVRIREIYDLVGQPPGTAGERLAHLRRLAARRTR